VGIRYAVDEKFFETWTPEMAYVLGYSWRLCLCINDQGVGLSIFIIVNPVITLGCASLSRHEAYNKRENRNQHEQTFHPFSSFILEAN